MSVVLTRDIEMTSYSRHPEDGGIMVLRSIAILSHHVVMHKTTT